MFLLIDHNKKIVTDYEGENYVFDSAEDALEEIWDGVDPDFYVVQDALDELERLQKALRPLRDAFHKTRMTDYVPVNSGDLYNLLYGN